MSDLNAVCVLSITSNESAGKKGASPSGIAQRYAVRG